MIVKCTNCEAAYSVDDSKVENKKFAFTCPKCSTENIIDNRVTVSAIASKKAAEKTRTAVPEDDFSAMIGEEPGQESTFNEPEESGRKRDSLPLDDFDEESIKKDEGEFKLDEGLDDFEFEKPKKEKPVLDELEGDIDEKAFKDDLDIEDTVPEDKFIMDEDIVPSKGKENKRSDTMDGVDGLLDDEELDKITDDLDSLEIEARPGDGKKGQEKIDDFSFDESAELIEAEHGKDDDILVFETLEDETPRKPTMAEDIRTEEVFPNKTVEEDDSTTIDLDSLDIDLDEDKSRFSEGEKPTSDDLVILDMPDAGTAVTGAESAGGEAKEDDITLDLDSLDIPLEMTDDIKQGEILDEDEKLTLEDAGLTLDELTSDEITNVTHSTHGMEPEEDIKLTIDDIDPSLNVDNIEGEIIDNVDDLKITIDEIDPDLNVDNLQDRIASRPEVLAGGAVLAGAAAAGTAAFAGKSAPEDEMVILERDELPRKQKGKDYPEDEVIDLTSYENEVYDFEEDGEKKSPARHGKGSLTFSIDYTLKFSRTGAFLRFFGLFFLGLIPHFVVYFIYSILSGILTVLNNLIILATGTAVKDFYLVHENTLRYYLSIYSSLIGIVEEMPRFAGRDDIDYPLQISTHNPAKPSKLLAFLRLTGIGIFIALLPHLFILSVASMAVPFVYLAGIVSVIATAKWPQMLFDLMVKYFRYLARILTFMFGLVDEYPSFKFD
ncbi:MAG: zinc-ribbon domain-containing protein [Spirochaetes bacterium]|jgi:hypothetical protein|nr:zinc-ribbon domain-containing protein [Spirochaetota bacterium]